MFGSRSLSRRVCQLSRLTLLAALAVVLISCETFHAVPQSKFVQHQSVEKIPISVAVFYGEGTRGYEYTYEWQDIFGGKERYVLSLGEATVSLFESAAQVAFENATVIGKKPISDPNIEAVIDIEIDSVDGAVGRPLAKTSWVEIAYKFTLYSASGDKVASWRVLGAGEQSGSATYSRPPPAFVHAAELAMTEAANRFLNSLEELPEVQRSFRELVSRHGA